MESAKPEETFLLSKEEFDSLYSDDISKKKFDEILNKISYRVDYLLRECFIKNKNGFWWEFEDEVSFNIHTDKAYTSLIGEGFDEMCYDGFETRWLYEENSEEEIFNLRKDIFLEQEKRKEQEKKRREENKTKKAEMKKSIKSKLTKEEFSFIRFVE